MKTKLFLVLALFASGIFYSCEKDKPANENEYEYVNNWILENMEIYYLWNDKIPSSTDKTLAPSEYFESLLYKDDRFSWIQDNFIELLNSLSGVSKEAGYDFNLLRMNSTDPDVIGYITYVKYNSPAEAKGLKRGDYFLSVNGKAMTLTNYSSVIAEMSQNHSLGLGVINGSVISPGAAVQLDVVEYEENPVYLDSIYHIDGKKIGYLVYNAFYGDKGDGSLSYEKQLNNVFGKFKAQGITDLIVDLRYNSGGAISSAIDLASMITRNLSATNVCVKMQYNSILHEYFLNEEGAGYFNNYFRTEFKGKSGETIPINNVGVEKVYFIVTNRTASASELVINSLNPFMETVLIGGTTVGKNVASWTIYEENDPKNKWGMQPIIARYANGQGFSDFVDGFTPDIALSEHSADEIKPLGDISELLLAAAIGNILGTTRSITKAASTEELKVIASSLNLRPERGNLILDFPKVK
jgi:C-terminal processing protease CtpA/Prc